MSDTPMRNLARAAALAVRCLLVSGCLRAGVRAGDPGGGLQEAPLAPRSGPPAATMFTLMPPEQTGIVTENRYDDPAMWGVHYQEIALGAMGTGVAIGDYDNDGRPDILVVSKTGGCRLFRNLGGWKFEDVTEKAGLGAPAEGMLEKGLDWFRDRGARDGSAWRQGAVFADVNNDGWLDIYVCRFGAPNLLYINQRDGTFKEEAAARGLAVADACGVGAFADYDRDGWLDVYVTTNMLDAKHHPNGQRGYLFHNNGDGTFTDVTEKAGIYGEMLSHSATWWDLDGDGWPDLYVTDDFAGADRLYHNNRDGTFTDIINEVVPHTPYSSMGSDFGDVNNDGRFDLLVADMAASTHEKDQRGMADSRALDAAKVAGSTAAPQYSRSALYLNTGLGRCLEAAQLAGVAATDWTWSVRFEDLDNDGRLDLFVTNGMSREYQNADLRDRIILAETLADRMRIMRNSPRQNERHLAYRNLGDLRFEEVGAAWGLDQRGVSFGAAFGDLDGDGDLDLVYANYQGGLTVLRNDCPTGHRVVVALRGTRSNRFGIGATVRVESALGLQVRQLVVSRGYLSSSEPIAHFGLGDDPVVKRLTVLWPSGAAQSFTDLPVDRRYTITEPSDPAVHPSAPPPPPVGQFAEVSAADGLSLSTHEAARHDANPQPLRPERFDDLGPALAVGDLAPSSALPPSPEPRRTGTADGGGRDDVLVGGTSADPARLLRQTGASRFVAASTDDLANPTLVEDGPLLLFDADGDGRNDILVTRAGTSLPAESPEYQPRLYLNDGRGGFRPAPADALPPLPISAGAVAAADFDRDGRLDVFIGGRVRPGEYPLAPRSALLVNRGGRFEDVTDALAPGLREVGMVRAALWSDVDGDGWPDLLLALEWGEVKYFHNRQGRGFEDWTERAGFAAAGTGWWTSLASADFNGDGRPDFVVGNVGLNTQYHASPQEPALLYFGDFAGGRPPQLVEAYYENGKLYPWRTRKELGAQIPLVLRRYRTNDAYARATLPEILGAERLGAARRFAATELRSGVFLSQPDGTYRFEPLPRIAQIAPLQGIVTGDFDGDGRADIYAVQNSYAAGAGVGRFDGGVSQLLRGDGRGHFTAVPPAESGLLVPGDAKALAVLDLDGDGWPDFLLTRNESTTLAFRNRGVPGRHALSVRLRGPQGNPDAIGARVSLELADGTTETAEVQAGSGYYSQSSACCFFGYPDANPPRRLAIRWPDGSTAFRALPPRVASLTVAQ